MVGMKYTVETDNVLLIYNDIAYNDCEFLMYQYTV